jgi:hypothetical protein
MPGDYDCFFVWLSKADGMKRRFHKFALLLCPNTAIPECYGDINAQNPALAF